MKNTLKFIAFFLFIIILGFLLFIFAMFQGGFVSWFLFFSYLPIFLYQLGLLCYPVKHWKVARILTAQKVTAGGSVSVMIHMQRKLPFPLYYCIFEEIIPQTMQTIDEGPKKYGYLNEPEKLRINRQTKQVVFPWFRRTTVIHYDLDNLPRGEHQLYAIRLKTADIFGFIKKEHTFLVQDKLIVYPADRSLYLTGAIQNVEDGTRSSAVIFNHQKNVISGVREYVSGDRISWIDWKQTARNQMMMTKEFEQEENNNVLCVLDQCGHDQLNDLAFEGIIETSLALIKRLQKQVAKVDLQSVGEEIHYFSSVDREAIYQHLTNIQPSEMADFSNRLRSLSIDFRDYASVFIVTTRIDESLEKTIYHMKKQVKKLSLILIQSHDSVSAIQQELVKQLTYEGITICKLTEHELIDDPLEVNIL